MVNFFKSASLFVTLMLVQSCETISYVPKKVIETSSNTFDFFESIFSDDNEIKTVSKSKEDPSLNADIPQSTNKNSPIDKNESKMNENKEIQSTNISDYDQVLKAVPPEKLQKEPLDSFDNNKAFDQIIKENVKNSIIANKENSDKTSKSDKIFNIPVQKLELKNKIQFRIATINFNTGSSSIKFNDIKKIKKVINIAQKKNALIRIVGHASTRTRDLPEIEHKIVNFNVSDRRAQSVAKVFIDNKFPKKRLITEAVSDSKPLFHESMPTGTFKNQRTEIYIIY